jgi:NADPH-dependent curcumin reductase CurA
VLTCTSTTSAASTWRPAIATLNDEGRVVLCGAITEYHNTEPAPGPRSLRRAISKRLTLRGLRTNAHYDLRHQFVTEVGGWIAEGRLHYRETVVEGIQNAPAAFLGMLRGTNIGKMLVELA